MKRTLSSLLVAGELSLTGTTDKTEPLYVLGGRIDFQIQLPEDGNSVGKRPLKWKRSGDDGKIEGAVATDREPLRISTSMDPPGFIRIEAWVLEENGRPMMNARKQRLQLDGGAGVEPEKLPAGTTITMNMAKRITCETNSTAALCGYVCPLSGVAVLCNNLKGPKHLEFIQGKTRSYAPRDAQRIALRSGGWESSR